MSLGVSSVWAGEEMDASEESGSGLVSDMLAVWGIADVQEYCVRETGRGAEGQRGREGGLGRRERMLCE